MTSSSSSRVIGRCAKVCWSCREVPVPKFHYSDTNGFVADLSRAFSNHLDMSRWFGSPKLPRDIPAGKFRGSRRNGIWRYLVCRAAASSVRCLHAISDSTQFVYRRRIAICARRPWQLAPAFYCRTSASVPVTPASPTHSVRLHRQFCADRMFVYLLLSDRLQVVSYQCLRQLDNAHNSYSCIRSLAVRFITRNSEWLIGAVCRQF